MKTKSYFTVSNLSVYFSFPHLAYSRQMLTACVMYTAPFTCVSDTLLSDEPRKPQHYNAFSLSHEEEDKKSNLLRATVGAWNPYPQSMLLTNCIDTCTKTMRCLNHTLNYSRDCNSRGLEMKPKS